MNQASEADQSIKVGSTPSIGEGELVVHAPPACLMLVMCWLCWSHALRVD